NGNQFDPGPGGSLPGPCQIGAAAAWIVNNADPLQLQLLEQLKIVVRRDVQGDAGNILAEVFFIGIERHGENNRHPAKLARLFERLVADNNHQAGLLFADDSAEIELGVIAQHQRLGSHGAVVLDEAYRLVIGRAMLALDDQQLGSVCRQGQEEGRYEEEEHSQNLNLTPPSIHLRVFIYQLSQYWEPLKRLWPVKKISGESSLPGSSFWVRCRFQMIGLYCARWKSSLFHQT